MLVQFISSGSVRILQAYVMHWVPTCIDHGERNNGSGAVSELVFEHRRTDGGAVPQGCCGSVGPTGGRVLSGGGRVGVGKERRCPHCGGAVSRGKSRDRTFDALHIQTAISHHSQIKGFLRRFRGIATKHLYSCPWWFHLVALGRHPSPRACLASASAKPAIRELSLALTIRHRFLKGAVSRAVTLKILASSFPPVMQCACKQQPEAGQSNEPFSRCFMKLVQRD